MDRTRQVDLLEQLGLIEVEEYGGKVRLWPEAELVELARAEASYCRANGKGDEHIEANIRSRYGDAAPPPLLEGRHQGHIKRPPDRAEVRGPIAPPLRGQRRAGL